MRTLHTLLATALLVTAGSAFAATTLSKEDAIAKAQAIHPGEVIKAYTEVQHGRTLWEVQIKGADGRKAAIFIDAETGEQDLKAK